LGQKVEFSIRKEVIFSKIRQNMVGETSDTWLLAHPPPDTWGFRGVACRLLIYITQPTKMFSNLFVVCCSFLICAPLITLRAHEISSGNNETLKVIPKLIIKSYEDNYSDLHVKFRDIFNSTLVNNPSYTMVYLNGKEREQFIAQIYPSFLNLYRSLIPGAFRADVFRYLILYRYGGIYNDMGIRYMRKIEETVLPHDEFVMPVDLDQSALYNAFIASYPRHPLIKQVIIDTMDNIYYQRYGCNALDITSPKTFGRAYHKMNELHPDSATISAGHQTLNHGHKYHLLRLERGDRITDAGIEAVHNKFEGYYAAIYKNFSVPYYLELWDKRQVFNNTFLEKTQLDQIKSCEANLLQRKRELWYVINGERRPFGSFDVFQDLGFVVGCQVRNVIFYFYIL
jgi:hypothetical protein